MSDEPLLSLRPCDSSSMKTLSQEEILKYHTMLGDWEFDKHMLNRTYYFQAFKYSLAFVNTIANIADVVGYYPRISFSKRIVQVTIGNGKDSILCDFILAAKMDAAYELMRTSHV